MATHAAFSRQGYPDALRHVTNLISDAIADSNAPPSLLPQVYFLYGEILKEQPIPPDVNGFDKYTNAIVVFGKVKNHWLEPLAHGHIGDCYLQLASVNPQNYEWATNEYQQVLNSTVASVSARSQAEFGLGVALEKQGQDPRRPESEQPQLLKSALDHYLNIVYFTRVQVNKGEQPDFYWVERAALSAGSLAERLGKFCEAVNIYKRLSDTLPALRERWEKKIEIAQQKCRNFRVVERQRETHE